jgi:hypothetical protein
MTQKHTTPESHTTAPVQASASAPAPAPASVQAPVQASAPAPAASPAPTPRKRWTNWVWGDFVLQLATVIIGILVTFGGSSLIQKRAGRRETATVLSMVKSELQGSLDRIEYLRERLAYEHTGAITLRPYIDNPEAMPLDSIEKYLNVIAGIRTFDPATNSLEVLENSSHIQNIRNMALVRDLFAIYGQMTDFDERLNRYNLPKLSILDSRNHMPHRVLEESYRDHRVAFSELMKFPAIRNFVVTTAGNDGDSDELRAEADSLAVGIPRVIEAIDKEVAQ